jgi:hypothetical protein
MAATIGAGVDAAALPALAPQPQVPVPPQPWVLVWVVFMLLSFFGLAGFSKSVCMG